MSTETPNPSTDQENAKDTEQGVEAIEESVLKDAVDPRDLIMKSRSDVDREELVTNPAVVPQMLNEPSDLRDDLKRD
jgi:hypothetical protein